MSTASENARWLKKYQAVTECCKEALSYPSPAWEAKVLAAEMAIKQAIKTGTQQDFNFADTCYGIMICHMEPGEFSDEE